MAIIQDNVEHASFEGQSMGGTNADGVVRKAEVRQFGDEWELETEENGVQVSLVRGTDRLKLTAEGEKFVQFKKK
jgi:hypothetical protein